MRRRMGVMLVASPEHACPFSPSLWGRGPFEVLDDEFRSSQQGDVMTHTSDGRCWER